MDGLLYDLIFDYTLRTVALGSAVLGIVAGVLGAFAVLRRQSLLGDAISHTALPGIALAFLITGTRTIWPLLLGAAVAGWAGTAIVSAVVRSTRIKYDSALGMILSVFFGLGLVLLTFIQRLPSANKAGLDSFLFGQASAIMARDVMIMSAIGGAVLVIVILLFKEFKVLCFDPDYGAALGMRLRVLDTLLTGLLVLAIVLGLQTVGVVLMSALVVAPAAAARQWTHRMGLMVALSAIFGALSGVGGTVISSSAQRVPTGPAIVLCAGAIVIVSILFAPARGIVWNLVRGYRHRRELQLEAVLLNLYELSLQHGTYQHTHGIGVLQAMSSQPESVLNSLRELKQRAWVTADQHGRWALSTLGYARAQELAAARGVER
jgi:manganese/zinc/iron transport system permease protein